MRSEIRQAMNNNKPTGRDTETHDENSGFRHYESGKLVYIRPILASDVIGDLHDEYGDLSVQIDAGATLYSVHDEDGERLALVGDRELAFAAARQYEMTPLSVH